MGESPVTRPSLLLRIRDAGDAAAWTQFTEVYVPLIYGFARKHGLQDADAADLTQEVLRSVSKAVRSFEYDPLRGSFRGWLFTVVRNKLRNELAAQGGRAQGTGDTAMHQLLAEQPGPNHAVEAEWDEDYQRQLFHWAAEQIRSTVEETTWNAFWQTAVEGKSGKQVAAESGLSVAAVYLAKSRVMARLKTKIKELQVT